MTDLREDLDSAIDELKSETHTNETDDGDLPEKDDAFMLDDSVSTDEPVKEIEEPEEKAEVEEPTPEAEETAEADVEASANTETYKAPVDWSPQARENWSKLPAEVQKQITDREAHIAQTLESNSQSNNTSHGLKQITDKHAQLLQREGVTNPLQAIDNFFGIADKLSSGTEAQRAEQMASLINHYKIDVSALDEVLSNGMTPQGQNNTRMEQMLDQRMQPMNNFIAQQQQQEQQRQYQEQQQANSEVANFQGEFLNDVRNQMADFIDVAANQGRTLGLKEAYDMAVSANPEISGILAQRKHNEAVTGNRQNIDDKRNAASTLQSGGEATQSSGNLTLREELEAQFQA